MWSPTSEIIAQANVTVLQTQRGLDSYDALHAWSVGNRAAFWQRTIERIGIVLRKPCREILDDSGGPAHPRWLPGARLNIAESCFLGDPNSTAILYATANGPVQRWSLRDLESLTNRVANALVARGLTPGDAIAVDLPMTAESVAIYLGIIKMGAAAVSIAESFAAPEIATRLRIGQAKLVFTQDHIPRRGRGLPLYEKVRNAGATPAVVLPAGDALEAEVRAGDLAWDAFLVDDDRFDAVACDPDDPVNILFSSGTTGDPKAIPWTHTTPIKSAADGHYHQDVHPGDVLAWPTSLGWMMGPWLIFASLVNRAGMALYYDIPTQRDFGEFIRDAGVTMLGVVPSLVKSWRSTGCMEGLDWSRIKLFSSTGECSNPDDMQYLMDLAGHRPVIEYLGGTEIGGGHLTGIIVKPAQPATFNTLALGIDAVILDPEGQPADQGELFLLPPSIGLSTRLLNRDHDQVYYQAAPTGPDGSVVRRHGDRIERLPGGYYRAHGRVDDTMNLGGIKVSSAEVERAVNAVPGVRETAAVAVPPPGGGPGRLVIFAVSDIDPPPDPGVLREEMQRRIRDELNPLFKIHRLAMMDALPRTASNKVMRRLLRAEGEES
jgi:acetyl-CoA synthetase